MPLFHIIILALIQGLTEFLPVSSSGHLVIAHEIIGGHESSKWAQDLLFDVAVHIGTLFAVVLYFWRDIISILRGIFTRGQRDYTLMLNIIMGSIPVIIAGLILSIIEPHWLRAAEVVAATTIIFGIILWWADVKYTTEKTVETLSLKGALMIGLAQILALIPGTSRSGITMTAGRMLRLSRVEAARFSMLLGIVAISGAGALSSLDLLKVDNLNIGSDLALAIGLSFVSGYCAIALMMSFLKRASFKVFALYRIALGIGLFALISLGFL